jgi:hypothetical protein
VGESLTVPEACEVVVMVRVEDPAVAVIVTDVALEDCQVSVTFCPALMDVGLAERVTLGADDDVAFELLAQEEKPHTANNINPQEIQRTAL